MKGKPKGIARKRAKDAKTVYDKGTVSYYGYGGGDPVINEILSILENDEDGQEDNFARASLEVGRLVCRALRYGDDKTDGEFSSFVDAVKARSTRRPADPDGYAVLIAVGKLERREENITAPALVRCLEVGKWAAKANGVLWDERHVRRVLSGLGFEYEKKKNAWRIP